MENEKRSTERPEKVNPMCENFITRGGRNMADALTVAKYTVTQCMNKRFVEESGGFAEFDYYC